MREDDDRTPVPSGVAQDPFEEGNLLVVDVNLVDRVLVRPEPDGR